MAITINIYYCGKNGAAVQFANEMISSGIVEAIRCEEGNLKYEYFLPMDDNEKVLLIDSWESQRSLDMHHQSPLMERIALLREKYDIHM
ncbi:MAG: antibiotic biosynthesis monooxygenase, partial [Anaeroplasmataceae bacterium]|nr:antibiotic biosynthesis monooxygenase [Anaeroplasmataceae bacterium]